MTNNTPSSNYWDVLVTLDATVSAWLKVEARSFVEAGDKAVNRDFVLSNIGKFELDEDNLGSSASNAFLPDPDDGIVPHDSDSPLGSINAEMTESQRQIMSEVSKAYNPEGGESFDLLDESSPEVIEDGLAMFLSRELQESMKGEDGEGCRVAAARSIMTAIKQLEDVLDAIDR